MSITCYKHKHKHKKSLGKAKTDSLQNIALTLSFNPYSYATEKLVKYSLIKYSLLSVVQTSNCSLFVEYFWLSETGFPLAVVVHCSNSTRKGFLLDWNKGPNGNSAKEPWTLYESYPASLKSTTFHSTGFFFPAESCAINCIPCGIS